MLPTHLPTYRHIGFDNLYGEASEYRGWGELAGPHATTGVPAVSGAGWAAAPTSPPQTHAGEEADRTHEDSKSGVLSGWETTPSAQLGYEAEMQRRYQEMVALGGGDWLHHFPPAGGPEVGKMPMEAAAGPYGPARPQSATSLSPPSHLAMPQPINPRLPNNMIGLNGGVRKYQCKMCPQAFHSKADLQLHTQIHLREPKPYKCANCGKAFANSSYLSQHTRIHLGIKPYRCEICQRKFTQLSHLQQHIRTHTGDKPYKCRIPGCTKAFSQLSNLQSHSRCHQSDKPYKCNSCYKCFSDEPALLEHIPKHRDSKHVKTHICAYCGKSYTQETYLAKHMQKHADRVDKRPPITAGPGHGIMSGLPDPYWPKMDPLAAMYGYQPALPDHHRIGDLDPREQPYAAACWDPRTSSAFSPLQPPVSAPKALSGYDAPHFPAKTSAQATQQEMKGNFISLSSIRNYGLEKPGGPGPPEKQ